MVLDAGYPALQDREITLDRVRLRLAPHILAERMADSLVIGEHFADFDVALRLIRFAQGLGMPHAIAGIGRMTAVSDHTKGPFSALVISCNHPQAESGGYRIIR